MSQSKQSKNSLEQRPFMGLKSFEETNQAQFGGRDIEIDELFKNIDDNGLTVVFGKSGIGKTSLIKAGLMPELRVNFYFPIYVRIDYSSDNSPLNQVKKTIYEKLKAKDESVKEFGDQTLWEYFHNLNLFGGVITPVMILDQFEETFTIGDECEDDVQELMKELADLAENRIPLKVQKAFLSKGETVPSRYSNRPYRVVFSLREDFLARLEELKELMPSIMKTRFRVVQMSVVQALDAATKPAKGLINKEVAREIIKKLPGISQADFDLLDRGESDKGKLKIEPFLLSLLCDRINEKRIAKKQEKITTKLVKEFDVSRVIESFYSDTLSKYEKNVETAIEELLLTEGGFRKLQSVEEMKNAYKISDEVIEALVDARILRNEQRDGVTYVELIHDVLAPVIKENRDIRHEQERLEQIKEAEREARAKHRAKIRAVLYTVVPVIAIILWFAVTNTMKVRKEEQRVEKMTKARSLLNKAKAEKAAADENMIKSVLLTNLAYRIFEDYSSDRTGENAFDQEYYNGMLRSLREINIHDNGDKKDILHLVNRDAEANSSTGVTILTEKELKSKMKEGVKNSPIKGFFRIENSDTYFIGRQDGSINSMSFDEGISKNYYESDEVIKETDFDLGGDYNLEVHMTFNNDNNHMAIVGDSSQIIITDLNTNKIHKRIRDSVAITRGVKTVHFDMEGQLIVSQAQSIIKYDSSYENLVPWDTYEQFIWERDSLNTTWTKNPLNESEKKRMQFDTTHLQIKKRKGDRFENISAFSVANNDFMALGIDGAIILMMPNKKLIHLNHFEFGKVSVLKFNPEGSFLIVGNRKGEVFVLKLIFNKKIEDLKDVEIETLPLMQSNVIQRIAMHPVESNYDSASFVVADRKFNLIRWSRENEVWSALALQGDEVNTKEMVIGIEYSADGDHIIAVYKDNTMIKWPSSMKKLSNLICCKLIGYKKIKEEIDTLNINIEFTDLDLVKYGLTDSEYSNYYNCTCSN